MKEGDWWEEDIEEEGAGATVGPFSDSDEISEPAPDTDDEEGAVTGPTLSGKVNMTATGEGSVLGSAVDSVSGSGLPKGAWFAIGLIGGPIVLGMFSALFLFLAEASYEFGGEEHWGDESVTAGDETVEVGGEDYHTYLTAPGSYIMEYEYWNYNVQWWEGDNVDSSYHTNCWGDSEDARTMLSDGNSWIEAHCNHEGEMPEVEVYIRSADDGGIVILANSTDVPNEFSWDSDSESQNTAADFFGILSVLIWPVGALGISLWGFTKGHSSLAWGVLTSVVIVPIILFGLCVAILVVLFGI